MTTTMITHLVTSLYTKLRPTCLGLGLFPVCRNTRNTQKEFIKGVHRRKKWSCTLRGLGNLSWHLSRRQWRANPCGHQYCDNINEIQYSVTRPISTLHSELRTDAARISIISCAGLNGGTAPLDNDTKHHRPLLHRPTQTIKYSKGPLGKPSSSTAPEPSST